MSPPPEDELICLVKAEIPEQLPRPYLIKDLYQWSCINLQDNGREQYGLPLAVVPYEEEGGEVRALTSHHITSHLITARVRHGDMPKFAPVSRIHAH